MENEKQQSTPEALCPSCGKFAGAYARCPHCGTQVDKRVSLVVLKWGSLVVAVGGLALLVFAARLKSAPATQVRDIGPTMNYAYVKIEGVVTRYPEIDAKRGDLIFTVDDGTGEIRVHAYRKTTEKLMANGLVPKIGEMIEVRGSLRVTESRTELALNVADHLQVKPSAAKEVQTKAVTDAMVDTKVCASGTVKSVSERGGATVLSFAGMEGDPWVEARCDPKYISGKMPEVSTGMHIKVTGLLSKYRQTFQVLPQSFESIVVTDELPPKDRPGEPVKLGIAEALKAAPGTRAVLQGTVTKVEGLKSGMKLTLSDGSSSIPVFIGAEVLDAFPRKGDLKEGASGEFAGELKDFGKQKERELFVDDPAAMRIAQ